MNNIFDIDAFDFQAYLDGMDDLHRRSFLLNIRESEFEKETTERAVGDLIDLSIENSYELVPSRAKYNHDITIAVGRTLTGEDIDNLRGLVFIKDGKRWTFATITTRAYEERDWDSRGSNPAADLEIRYEKEE